VTVDGDELHGALAELIRRVSAAAAGEGDVAGHAERMARTCALLGKRIGLDDARCDLVRLASPLHDIGKVALPSEIVAKQGPLTTAERRVLEGHAAIGHRMLSGSGSQLLELAATIAWTHHERYDGTGYPRGLAKEAIPIEGRIAAVADVFHALTSDRSYRPAFPLDQALRLVQDGRGAQFDPEVLDAFVDAIDEIVAIREGVVGGGAQASRLARSERRWRRRRAEAPHPHASLSPIVIEDAAEEAVEIVRTTAGDRQAIDAGLLRLRESVGPDLLVSMYVFEHDRLWCLTQQGYDEMRDGFPLDRGVMARAFKTGEVQFVPDVRADPDFIPAMRELRSEIAVPVSGVGVLNVETRRLPLPRGSEHAFDRLAEALAERAERLRSELGLGLSSLAHLFVYASSLRGPSAISEFSTRTLGRLLDLEAAQLSLGRPTTGYSLASFWRRPDSTLEPLPPFQVERFAQLAGEGDTAITVFDLSAADAELDGRRWLVWLPLQVGGDSVGALVGCASRRLDLDDDNVEAATLFAPHAAALIDVAQALRREQRAAVTDSLTGLLNRRGFEPRFREELERAERASRSLAVIVVDCDGLKAVNDRGGHELGDTVLLLVARSLRTQKRSSDIAARLGGDEFVLLMPEIEPEGALTAAERLRRSLVDQVLENGQLVTATFGVAVYPSDGRTATDLLRAADRALYVAKESGRNRTALFRDTLRAPS
jgi:diguanylate cyclase (GGDEF)-like protein